ncbi:pyridoxamine 5'-phosphate oxidase [Coralloluteibacterium stylophorae]|uniref:Pyridoxine/pyridoxamine 5'-phosphate oxidase n=1 Tax=Coralloluteibacterium stylophorae TaxID=1776034 RepID=A0A8J7VQQ4_9GAMM|nr:pyridoxamine 5'-phosphate oxidase [Coralloluteibacterium stylophorae]MBS7456411.1 pyridoxamine 5'-phosphate oxidase [Coralloluteibacterium stylophorae]
MSTVPRDVLDTFEALLESARGGGEPEPTAMTVATSTPEGRPSARTVLLKAWDERGFVFYTHLDSHKGSELQANAQAALLFLWKSLPQQIQVRIEGDVEVVDDAEADAYFASRPRGSQIGAWASRQSRTLPDRGTFERALAESEARFADAEVPRPPRWSGFRVVPRRIEFWYGMEFRLHERHVHERDAEGHWSQRMLYP